MTRLSESSMSEPLAAGAADALELLFDRPPLTLAEAAVLVLALRGSGTLTASAGAAAAALAEGGKAGAEFCLAGAAGRGALRPVDCWPVCDLRRLTAAPLPPAVADAGGVEVCLPLLVAGSVVLSEATAFVAAAPPAASFLAAPGPRFRAFCPPRLPALPLEVFELVREAAGAVGLAFWAVEAGVDCGPADEVEVGGGAGGAEGAFAGSDMAGTGGRSRLAGRPTEKGAQKLGGEPIRFQVAPQEKG